MTLVEVLKIEEDSSMGLKVQTHYPRPSDRVAKKLYHHHLQIVDD
jgi:hypothetical protein